ncbi:MAG: cob(I)yrinic acid a,c-diamide adenosyltransferase [Pseudobutyrivibrio sp.]|nr:cob(I)yrinic acid a,c-diamide adenosyltransferase [Pseudobutyrivibrio sp.]
MIHLYTGEGKGKTTAATGLAVRAAGNGMKVIYAQFMKGNETGEINSLSRLEGVTILRGEKNYGFYKNMSDDDRRDLTRIHNQMMDEILCLASDGQVSMIILDEITHAMKYALVDESKIESILKLSGVETVLTGRAPKAWIVDKADYVTEMKKVKHPFDAGVKARKGIEF